MNTYQELVYEIAVIRGNIARMSSLIPNSTFAEAEELSDAIVELNAELDNAIDCLYTNYPEGDPDAGPCPVMDMGVCDWCPPCEDCDCAEDNRDFCEFGDSCHNGAQASIQFSEDLDQSYQLDVLLNEMNVMAGQIEYLQDENDYLQDELKDAEDAIDYWCDKAQDCDDISANYDDLLAIFHAVQNDYQDLEQTLFTERASYEKANDLLHDDIIDLQYAISELTQRLADTSERAVDYWKRIKALEASRD